MVTDNFNDDSSFLLTSEFLDDVFLASSLLSDRILKRKTNRVAKHSFIVASQLTLSCTT
jgi:hypothetical protein